jgi:hypothetical protein
MTEYTEFKTIFYNSDNFYNGGYVLDNNLQNEDKYLGGKENSIIERFNNMVVPFGLFYKNRSNDLHEHTINILSNSEKEAEIIEPDLFDRLFFAVGKIDIPKKNNHSNNKTKKIHKLVF